MFVVVAIASIISAVAVPAVFRALRANHQQAQIRDVLGDLQRVRSLAMQGARYRADGSPIPRRSAPPSNTIAPTFTAKLAGIKVNSRTSYSLFVRDATNSNEQVVDVVVLDPDTGLEIVWPRPGTAIAFKPNGTLANGSRAQLTLGHAPTRQTHRIEVGFTGATTAW